MSGSRRTASLCAAVAVVAMLATGCTTTPPVPPANPPVDSPGVIGSAVPAANTPSFSGPSGSAVKAVGQAAGDLIVGGSFTAVNSVSQAYLAAVQPATNTLDTGQPVVNGEVDAIEPTAGRSGFYAAGKFTSAKAASGAQIATNIALFSVTTHQLITTFTVKVLGNVNALALVGTHLLIGGYFSKVDGVARNGLASVNYTTGAVEPYFAIQLSGHHNFGRVAGALNGPVGAFDIAVSPDGSRAIVDGNFTTAADSVNPFGYARDQIVNIKLTPAAATVDPYWNTNAYTNPCYYKSYDSYVQHIGWAPNGSYFVVAATGGYHGGTFQDCDAASRFNASSTGLSVQPEWIDFTGTDSIYSVAVTSSAVYIGGHYRWLNNPYGQDDPRQGAVPRPGLAALDPVNGVPLSWNPGRNPRGHGAELIYATSAGIWVGSDTNCIGPGTAVSCVGSGGFERDELAFFPYAGGSLPAANNTGNPAQVYVAGSWISPADTLAAHSFNPTTGAGQAMAAPDGGGIAWGSVRGAFTLDGRVWYGKSDGNFYYRTYDGTTFGPETLVDPYDDPTWDPVRTGSPTGSTNTYQGVATSFYAQIPSISGMFYANRSIYYSLAGDPRLYRRDFSPDTTASPVPGQDTGGVISPVQVTVVASGGPVNFSYAGGMWVAGGKLWIASAHSGSLYEAPWNGVTITGSALKPPATTNPNPNAPGNNWSGRGVFVAP